MGDNIRRSTLRAGGHHTHSYCLNGRVDGGGNTKQTQSDVCSFLPPSMRTCLVVKHRRVNETKRHATKRHERVSGVRSYSLAAQHPPGETSHERDELVEVIRASPADCRAPHDSKEPKHVLLPFDIPVHLPTSSEETVLHNPYGGEELQWHGKQNRERIEELHRLREARRGVKVLDDDRVDVGSKSEIGKCTSAAKEDLGEPFRCNLQQNLSKLTKEENHDAREYHREFVRLTH